MYKLNPNKVPKTRKKPRHMASHTAVDVAIRKTTVVEDVVEHDDYCEVKIGGQWLGVPKEAVLDLSKIKLYAAWDTSPNGDDKGLIAIFITPEEAIATVGRERYGLVDLAGQPLDLAAYNHYFDGITVWDNNVPLFTLGDYRKAQGE